MKEKEKDLEKELDQTDYSTDEVLDDDFDTVEEISERSKYIRYGVIAAGVIVLLVGGWLLYGYYQDNAQRQASIQLSRIRPYYEQNVFDAALNGLGNATMRGEKVPGLKAIADENSGNEAGKLAALYAANSFVALGDFNQAERYFDQASSASAPITRLGGLAGLASCKAQKNASAEAAKLYEEAASVAEKMGEEDRFRLFAALQYEKAGQKDQALKIYQAIAAMPEFSEITSEAKFGIVRLGGTVQ